MMYDWPVRRHYSNASLYIIFHISYFLFPYSFFIVS